MSAAKEACVFSLIVLNEMFVSCQLIVSVINHLLLFHPSIHVTYTFE